MSYSLIYDWRVTHYDGPSTSWAMFRGSTLLGYDPADLWSFESPQNRSGFRCGDDRCMRAWSQPFYVSYFCPSYCNDVILHRIVVLVFHEGVTWILHCFFWRNIFLLIYFTAHLAKQELGVACEAMKHSKDSSSRVNLRSIVSVGEQKTYSFSLILYLLMWMILYSQSTYASS